MTVTLLAYQNSRNMNNLKRQGCKKVCKYCIMATANKKHYKQPLKLISFLKIKIVKYYKNTGQTTRHLLPTNYTLIKIRKIMGNTFPLGNFFRNSSLLLVTPNSKSSDNLTDEPLY